MMDQIAYTTSPQNKATNINPDTHLVLTFSSPPKIGTSGLIRIYDATDKKLVDTLDMKIPASPNPSGRAPKSGGATKAPGPADRNDKKVYQTNHIGGFDFHFFPIIVRGNVATISLHNGKLKYGRTYIVKMDPEVLHSTGGTFAGFRTDTEWTFTTKPAAPPPNATRLVVAADGSGDFNTLQGALDSLPASPAKRVTIFIKNGDYEEIVFMYNKNNVIIRGESRDKVKVGYKNNSAFNQDKGGPSRRPAFSIVKCRAIQLSRFTINNYFIGQAEALLVNGQEIIIDHMTLSGSGDAFQTAPKTTIYFADSKLTGHGDTVLGYGAVFFLRSEIHSIGPFTWTRTAQGNHGNIFVNSTLVAIDEPLPWTVTASGSGQKSNAVLARLPRNKGKITNFPNAEMILINTRTSGIPPVGWGPIEDRPGFDSTNVHFWEHNTMDMAGRPIDMSKRHRVSKQLRAGPDAKVIAEYSRPEFVLGGWKPVVE